jgi:hypothetical protein
MCSWCDWEQTLVTIRMMLGQDIHTLDVARLERLQLRIGKTKHVTPMQKQEVLAIQAQDGEF